MRKVAVFPVPDWAWTMTSWPSMIGFIPKRGENIRIIGRMKKI